MRVFVYEYLSSGAAGEQPASLRTEGWAMLSAVLEDFGRCRGVETVTLLDPRVKRFTDIWTPYIIPNFLRAGSEEDTFRALAASADFSLVIAPEFDDILLRRCRWVEAEGGRLLGPSSTAVRRTADKLTMACHWKESGIPTPSSAAPYPLVCKPRFGAGSQATFLVHNKEELARARRQAQDEGWSGELLLQPYMRGLAVSVSFLAGGEWHALPAAEQHLSNDGRFRYLGGRLPLPSHLDRRARSLAERAARCVEGLHGWFGVDLILGDAEDGSGDAVIEINPRLTTSYVGLRRLAHFNLAEALLAITTGSHPPSRDWGTEPIAFRANGAIVE
jgi:predicted ATP-grasp superfamily ATP-dependent carboligase